MAPQVIPLEITSNAFAAGKDKTQTQKYSLEHLFLKQRKCKSLNANVISRGHLPLHHLTIPEPLWMKPWQSQASGQPLCHPLPDP